MAIGDSNHKGNVAELKIAAAAADLGIDVLRPMTEHGRYDLVFEVGGQLMRIQCKWATRKADVVVIPIRTSYHSPTRGYVVKTYGADEVDAVVAYCGDTDTCYFLPIDEIEGMGYLHLRLAPTKNGQRAGVRMAASYELGAVAQLEVAPRWHRGGRRFEPGQLHPASDSPQTVGAHEFRNRFGWYMERAAAGETFHVTRRGKPYVRLTPAQLQPKLT